MKEKRKKYLDKIPKYEIKNMIELMSSEKGNPKEISEVYDEFSIYDIHYLLKRYYGYPYNDWKKMKKRGLYGDEWYKYYGPNKKYKNKDK